MAYPDGSKYTGDWVNGVRQGDGALAWADGSVFEGRFEKGEMTVGTITWEDGSWQSGEYYNNQWYAKDY
jgi:hypothetical protein